ncbi:MAG: flagellar hook-basal body complex protein FliE [Candidatus Marinimicrobia bacterium]|nr:flagellar hook-basal body complex protein FliE [Candidatus Neomarinimicrobiota bacterium]
MKVNDAVNLNLINEVEKIKKDQKTKEINFGETIKNFLEAVNSAQKESQEKVSDVITGKSDDLTEAMVKMEEARLSFNLMLEIRNKLVEAYKEIERMPV